jgi:hypothetical protein
MSNAEPQTFAFQKLCGFSPFPKPRTAESEVRRLCATCFVEAVLDGAPLLSSGATALWTDWVTAQAVASAAK